MDFPNALTHGCELRDIAKVHLDPSFPTRTFEFDSEITF